MSPDPVGFGRFGLQPGGYASAAGRSSSVRGASAMSTPPGLEGLDFAAMVREAQRGKIRTDLPVTIAPGANVELRPDQLEKLAEAADMAQAKGVQVAAVLLDDVSVVLDVGSRRVISTLDAKDRDDLPVRTGVDGVIDLRSEHIRAGRLPIIENADSKSSDDDKKDDKKNSSTGDGASQTEQIPRSPFVDQSDRLWRMLASGARV